MSDWIDEMFSAVDAAADEELERRRDGLFRQLDQCRFEYNVEESYVERILSFELTLDECSELSTTFQMNKLDVRYQYAPSQRALSRWIRSFCFDDEQE